MGFIPEEQINDLKSRLDIVDTISEYVNLNRAGSNFKGLCPFHSEKTPSFMVSPQKNIFHCFGCHKGGDSITFIMEIENLDYISAIRFLADKMGITLEETEYSSNKNEKRNRMYEINSMAAKYYMRNFLTNDFPQNYIKNRGLSIKILNRFFLGYAKSTENYSNDDLMNYLESKNIKKEEMLELGLINKKDDRYFDKFTDRLIFPILNNKNKVIGFGGRTLINNNIKYLNSPESEIFVKGKNIYGIHIVNKTRNRSKILLVEGYMDVIALYNNGIDYAVATLGTALTEDQANLIRRYSRNIYICYDGDEAGIKATLRAIDIFKNMDVNLGIVEFPDNLDPDEFLGKYGREEFDKLIEGAALPIDFKLKKLYEAKPNKLDFIQEIIEFLVEIEGNTIRDLYTDKAAKFIGVTTDSLRNDINIKLEELQRKEEFKKNYTNKNKTKSYQKQNIGYKNSIQKKVVSVENVKDKYQESLEKEFIIYSLIDLEKFDYLKEYSRFIQNIRLKAIYEQIEKMYKNDLPIENILNMEDFKILGLNREYNNIKKLENIGEIVIELKEKIKIHKLRKKKKELEDKLKENPSDNLIFQELMDIIRKLT